MSADIAGRMVAAINDRDRSAVEDLSSPGVQLRLPPGRVFYGRDGVHAFFDELEKLLPDLTVAARKVWRGMGFVIVEWEAAAHSLAGTARDSMGVVVLELDAGGRIERVQLYLDTAEWDAVHGEAFSQ
jgi:hypothetical protein